MYIFSFHCLAISCSAADTFFMISAVVDKFDGCSLKNDLQRLELDLYKATKIGQEILKENCALSEQSKSYTAEIRTLKRVLDAGNELIDGLSTKLHESEQIISGTLKYTSHLRIDRQGEITTFDIRKARI